MKKTQFIFCDADCNPHYSTGNTASKALDNPTEYDITGENYTALLLSCAKIGRYFSLYVPILPVKRIKC